MDRMSNLIDRQAAIDAIESTDWYHVAGGELVHGANSKEDEPLYKAKDIYSVIENVPSAQPEPCGDMISREYLKEHIEACWINGRPRHAPELNELLSWVDDVPSEQPEQRCVNCGRTVNNGGWYKDGRTRCPIEEHYALPKDGYCHLWEKKKVWEDDYVKRPEEGEK